MRKVFIDCGGLDGCSMRKFLTMHNDFEHYTFEPNIKFKDYYTNLPNHTLINKAVWIYDGQIRFFIGGKSMEGSSIFGQKTNLRKNEYEDVDCVDLSLWIKNNFSKDDYIILKLDVECAEYRILDKMMKDGTLDMVNELLVEFHWRKHKIDITQEEHDDIMARLNAKIKWSDWDALDFQIYKGE